MVMASSLQSFPIADSFHITLFGEPIHPILSLICHSFGDDDANIDSKASLGFLRKMMQFGHLFDIPAYLAKAIRFQLQNFPTTSYFRYYSMLLFLFVYNHVDQFECLGLSLVASNKLRKSVFNLDIAARKRQEPKGYYILLHGHCLQNHSWCLPSHISPS